MALPPGVRRSVLAAAFLVLLVAAGCTKGGSGAKQTGSVSAPATDAAKPPAAISPGTEQPAEGAEPPAPTPPPSPEPEATPEPLPFTGRLVVSHRGRLQELAEEPDGTLGRREIGKLCARCEEPAGVSPDGRHLLYSTPRATMLRDLRSGEERAVLPEPSSCLRFSPDGARFSYVRTHLYVSDLSGRSDLVYEAPSAVYTLFTHVGSTGEGSERFYGEVDCAVWLGPKRLAFDRFAGSMPRSLGEDTDEFGRSYYEELEPNGTSLATLEPGPTLEHAGKKIGVTASCASGRYVLLRNDALLAPGSGGLASFEPRRLVARRVVLGSGFLPATCTPYVVTVNGFKVADPKRGKVSASYDVDAGETGFETGRSWQGVWVSDPRELIVIVVDYRLDTRFRPACPCSLSLLDLETGAESDLYTFSHTSTEGELPQVLAWLPD